MRLPVVQCRDGIGFLPTNEGYYWSNALNNGSTETLYCNYNTETVKLYNWRSVRDGLCIRPVYIENYCDLPVVQYPLYEDFANLLPLCWDDIDRDGDGRNWYFGSKSLYDGSYVFSLSRFNTTALTPDNWLITKKLKMGSSGSQLKFLAGVNPYRPSEHLQIMVSTTDNNPSSFITAAEYTFTAAGYIGRKTVDLSAYNNQTIYIAFVHNQSTDNDFIALTEIEINTQNVNGIEDLQAQEISLYPNPAKEVLHINLLSFENSTGLKGVEILDLAGRKVGAYGIRPDDNAKETIINVASLPLGIYFVKINTLEGTTVRKFVKE